MPCYLFAAAFASDCSDFVMSAAIHTVIIPGKHPVPIIKPLELCRHLIKSYSHPGQTVLDPFCGGGSTVAAALLEERNVIGIEMDPVHFATTQRRAEDILQR